MESKMEPSPSNRGVLRRAAIAAAAALAVAHAAQASPPAAPAEWRFSVLLGDREIGQHRFALRANGATLELRSEANLNVRILAVSAFSYRHEAIEHWNGDCLQRIESRTDHNGKPYSVEGRAAEDGFQVRTRAATTQLPACVMSFAYWNPRILQQQRLLNTQTGELLEVRIDAKGTEQIQARGSLHEAQRYTILGRKLQIDLWYATDGRWLGLESLTDSGRKLRYVLL